jgi:hypothetical protein
MITPDDDDPIKLIVDGLVRGQESGGSNPLTPTMIDKKMPRLKQGCLWAAFFT